MAQKPFSLVRRKDRLTNGKPTYYVRFRSDTGERLPWRSTGQTSKLAAEAWAIARIREGNIAPSAQKTFGQFSEPWWVWDQCPYIARKLARGKTLSRSYADTQRTYLTNHILPYFQNMKLSRITPKQIEEWILQLQKSSSLSPTTINHCLTTLKIMLGEAAKMGLIPSNPAASVEPLKESPLQKSILTVEEVRTLFTGKALFTFWKGNLPHYTLNLLAATTGMRMGEIQALQAQHVHPEYVEVLYSWARKYGLKPPKTNRTRIIPIPELTAYYLQETLSVYPRQPEELIFSVDGKTPFSPKAISQEYYKALQAMGISPQARKERNITFHSWRHLFNTLLRNRIPDYTLQQLTGHRTQEMTDHYTHLRLEDLQEVRMVQNEVFRYMQEAPHG